MYTTGHWLLPLGYSGSQSQPIKLFKCMYFYLNFLYFIVRFFLLTYFSFYTFLFVPIRL